MTLYVKGEEEKLITTMYVDDILVTGSNEQMIMEFKFQLEREFAMSDLGVATYFLGMEILQIQSGIFLSQK